MLTLSGIAVGGRDPTSSSLERYDVILQRRPFSVPVETDKPVQPPPEETKKIFARYRMCAITFDGETLCVGLLDEQAKPPKSYLFGIGESEDGVELVDANYERGSALLRKDDHEQWLYMSPGDSILTSEPSSKQEAALAASLSLRLVKRREAVRQRRNAARAKENAAKDEVTKLREAQMESIRRGDDALQIPLTPGMDDQLVIEGLLPPQGKQIEKTMGDGPTVEESVVNPPVEGTNSGARL